MRSFVAALALGAALSFAPCVHAGTSGNPIKQVEEKKHHGMKGTVSSVDGETVVVTSTNKDGKAKEHKFKTDSNTKVTLDGAEAKLSSLKAGQEVTVTPGAKHGDPVAAIDATSAK
jgi:hypothetical protein